MHLALNFQRVDPARGGAETYVADLCRHLVEAGHRVDLYAESWADGCLPGQVNVVPVAGPGRTRMERIWNFARNSEAALSQASYDCSVGFVNTWVHDVIIPQGGVQAGSLRANARRFSSPLARRLYLLAKTANPKYWVYRAIEQRQYSPKQQPRVVAVSNMVKQHLEHFHHLPRSRSTSFPTRSIPAARGLAAGAVRCAFRNRLGLEPSDLVGLFAGHNFALKGLKPLLLALGEPTAGAITPAAPFTCWFAAAAMPVLTSDWPIGSACTTRSTSWVSIRTSERATGRATSSFSPPITTRARSSCWKPWPAACP